MPRQTDPSRAKPGRAQPYRAEPVLAEPRRATLDSTWKSPLMRLLLSVLKQLTQTLALQLPTVRALYPAPVSLKAVQRAVDIPMAVCCMFCQFPTDTARLPVSTCASTSCMLCISSSALAAVLSSRLRP